MEERIHSLITRISRENLTEELVADLEEVVTSDEAVADSELALGALEAGWTRLGEAGRWEAACRVMEIASVLVEDRQREIGLLREQARVYDEELYDQEKALETYRRIAEIDPDDIESAGRVEAIESERENWKEIVEKFVEQAEEATEPSLKAHMLYSAAERTYKNDPRSDRIMELLHRALDEDVAHLKAARLLERTLKEKELWSELVELYDRLAAERRSKEERAQLLLAAAYVQGRELDDEDEAARRYSEVLDLLPGNQTALRFLVGYYEAREDWDHLVAVYEDGLRGRLEPQEETAMLMQAGMAHWRMRGDPQAAEPYFRRLRKHEPAHRGMLNFYRSYTEETGSRSKLLQILNDAQRATDDSDLSAELTREIAEIAGSEGGNIEKAIDAYKKMLRDNPDDAEVRDKLKLLYRRAEKWNNLLDTLKTEAEALPDDDIRGKIAIYQEIIEIYRDHLNLEMMVIRTYDAILKLDPENSEALDELTKVYESAKRWNDLIKVLNRRVEVAESHGEKVDLLNRIASLWIERFNNFNRAVDPLEQILEIDPGNRAAIDTLKGVYEKRRAWRPLLELLDKETEILEGNALRDRLIEMARLASDRLSDHERAVALWRRVLEVAPSTSEALPTLEKLCERRKDWKGLADVLEERIERETDEGEKVALLTKLGTVCKDRLKDPARAAGAWRRLLEVQPGNNKAMRSLRDAYQAAEDWDSLEALYAEADDYETLVEVLGTAADRVSDSQTKIDLSFRCAELYADPIDQPDRAVRHYERVLSVDPKNERAARELVPIYRRGEKWSRLISALEVVLEHTADSESRLASMEEIREIASARLRNRQLAFEWAARAFEEAPREQSVRETLEKAAQESGEFDRLVEFYRAQMKEFDEEEQLRVKRYLAQIDLEQVGAVDDAVELYRSILEERPGDEEALEALDNIFRTSARWEDLVQVFERRIELSEDPAAKRDLVFEMARIFEEGMDDPIRAAARYREVLEIAPGDEESLLALERIFREGEQWNDLVEILERRRTMAEVGDDGWYEISFQVAGLLDEQLEERSRSIMIYRELLETRFGDPRTIEEMERFLRDEDHRVDVARALQPHLVAAEDWRRLAWVLAILIESEEEPSRRLELNVELAEVYGERLGDLRVAFDTIGAALRENPDNVDLWERLSELADRLDLHDELADRLGAAYEAEQLDEELRLDLARRLASLLDEHLARAGDAEKYHRKVLEHDPGARQSFQSLEDLYTVDERWDDLRALYRTALEGPVSDERRLDLLLKVCFIVGEVEHDVEAAIAAYRDVLEVDPGNEQAVRSLTSLYEEAERWDDLSALLKDQLQEADEEQELQFLYRLGEIAEHFQRNYSEALDQYEIVIRRDPDHLRAQEALERLLENEQLRLRAAGILERTYEHQGAAEPLSRVLAIQLEDEDLDPPTRVEILTRIADLRERRLNDPSGAFEALGEAFSSDPGNEIVSDEIARMAADNGMEAEYAELIDRVIPRIEDDAQLASKLMSEVAELYDQRLGNMERAETAYRRLLDHDPDNPETALPAVEALDRLLTASEQWEDLLEVLRQRVRLLLDPGEQKEVLHRMAEIEESVLERVDRAITLFREILELDETDTRALSGLERLYERQQQWRELIEVLRRRAALETSVDMRRELLLRVARLFEEELEDPEEALEAYVQVNDEAGPDVGALASLARLYERSERWSDLLDTLEMQEPLVEDERERAQMLFRMGDLLGNELDEPERAVDRLGETLRIDSGHSAARASLEALLDGPAKLEVIEILKPICEAEGDYERLLKFAEVRAEESDDPLQRAEVLREAAEVAEVGLEDPQRAFELLGHAFRDAASSPDLPRLVEDLERLSSQVDGFARLVDLYREVAPEILDGDLQVRCYLRAAEVADGILEDHDTAREYYVKVLDMDGENEQAMNALERIYEEGEQWVDLFEIYRRKVQSAYDESARRDILFKQARVCEVNLEDVSGAAQTYEQILEDDPESSSAMEALERLYPRLERWADLMDLLDRRVELEPSGQVEVLHRLGSLAEKKLGDDERALDYFRRALATDPNHGATLKALESAMEDDAKRGRVAEILEPVYKLHGDWAKLAGALDARLELTDDPLERKELLRQIGTVHEEQLGDLEGAFETFARLFHEDVEDRGSWDLLGRLSAVLENWERLAEVYSAALEDVVGDTPETAELAFMLGEIYEHRMDEPVKAKAAYQRVLAFSPDDEKAFSAVERMLQATESWPDLLELYRDAADAALDAEQRKGYIYKIAEIQERANEDLDAAITAYRDVLDIDDRDERAIAELDRLFHQAERFEDLAVHLRSQVDREVEPERRNELRRRLASVFEEQLEDVGSAVDVLEEALMEEGGDRAALHELERLILDEEQRRRIAEILEPIYREEDQWKKLVVILKTQVEVTDIPGDKVSRFKEIAQLHENRGRNYLLAFNSLCKAFETDPSDHELLGEMVRLAEMIENWEGLAGALSESLEEIFDMDFKMEVLHLLGGIYDKQLDMPRRAIESYREILESNEADAKALDALEGLYNLVGDWEGLVGVLASKAGFAADPAERSELLRTKASIHEDLMTEPEEAIDSYRQALEADPSAVAAMDALERLYEGSGQWVELIDVKRQRLDLLSEPDERIAVLKSIAQVQAEKLEDAHEAIAAWREVLEIDDRDKDAIAALDRLFTAEEMFPELLENLLLQKDVAQDQALWVDISMRIGELQEQQLADLEGAIDSYRDVLFQQPTHPQALDALERLAKDETVSQRAIGVLEPLHREAERWDRLAELLELKLEIVQDPHERLEELLALAGLHETGRSDPAAAFDVYARALGEDPARTDVMEIMERIASAEGFWKRLAEVYERQSEDVFDPEVERSILGRLGEIREVHLEDSRGAIEAYRRVLDSGAADVSLMAALDRLYEREEMWAELDEVLEQEISVAEDSEESNRLKLRQGAIREREFDDPAGAISAYRDVAEMAPENGEAIAALEGLLERDELVPDLVDILTQAYEARGEQHKIGELFEHRLRVAADDLERVQLFRELAMHQEQTQGDPSSAFDAYTNAFKLAPTDAALLEELERLASELGSWETLVETSEQVLEQGDLDPIAEVELGLKVARWASTQLGDPRMAENRYRAVLERDAEHREALDALIDLLRSLGRFADLLPVLKQKADVTFDFQEKKQVLFDLARIARDELGDHERAGESYREVLSLDESDLEALDALIQLEEETEQFEPLAERLLSRSEFTTDPAEGNGFRHRAATLFVGPLGQPERAVDVYREILTNDPTDENAGSQLENLLEQLERWNDFKDVLLQRLDATMTEEGRVELLARLADLAERRFDDPEEAADHLREILMIAPFDQDASAALERIYTKTERWDELVEMLEDRAAREHEAGNTEEELTSLVRVGEIFDQRLENPERATEIYERVLEVDAEHTRALAALARLYENAEDWERCAEVLRKAAEAGRGGPDEAEVHYRLARLNLKQLGDEEAATTELQKAVKMHPGHVEANRELGDHCREKGDYQGLLEALMREEAYLAEDSEKVDKLLEIADLQRDQLSDPAGAVASLERAREIAPRSTEVLLRLSDGYLAADRQGDAIPVIESLIDAETDGGKKRSKKAAVYHQRLAVAYLGRGERDRALEHLEKAYKLDISNTEVLVSLGKLHYESEDYAKAAKLFRALLLQKFDPSVGASKADIYWYVGDISLKQGDARKAKGMFQRGLDEDSSHEGCKSGLEQCK